MTTRRDAAIRATALVSVVIGLVAAGCGKYGRPRRTSAPASLVFVTGPAPQAAAPLSAPTSTGREARVQ